MDESIAQLTKAEALKAEKSDKERELQNLSDTSGASGHQKLRVCDICGAYLSVLDSDRRLADHFGGKVSDTPAQRHTPEGCAWGWVASARVQPLTSNQLTLSATDAHWLPPNSHDDG